MCTGSILFIRDFFFGAQQFVPREILLLVAITLCFIVLSVFFFLFIIFSRISKNRKEKRVGKLRKKFELLITSVIFDPEDLNLEQRTQRYKLLDHYKRNYLRTSESRQVLIDEILHLYRDFTGAPARALRHLYLSLSLYNDSIRKLKDPRWHIKTKGVKELSAMEAKQGYSRIYRLVNHSNPILRMEAQLALVKIMDFRALTFLDDTRYPISEWQQINLLGVMASLDRNMNLPDISKWLRSANESVIIFTLKMISYFSLMNLTKEVTRMLNHPSLKVRKAVVQTIGDLDAASALGLLKKRFYNYEKDFKLAVIGVSRKIAIEKDFPFLELQLLSDDRDISQATAYALAGNSDSGLQLLKGIYSTYADEHLKGIIRNALHEAES
ncbi:MAG: hypothetical protein IT233_03320 [Bacteroidia bacterium]|nr:hypothetical protein [Bacteroidia bacterium]